MKQRGKKKKRIKRNEDNLRDLWDNVKHKQQQKNQFKELIQIMEHLC